MKIVQGMCRFCQSLILANAELNFFRFLLKKKRIALEHLYRDRDFILASCKYILRHGQVQPWYSSLDDDNIERILDYEQSHDLSASFRLNADQQLMLIAFAEINKEIDYVLMKIDDLDDTVCSFYNYFFYNSKSAYNLKNGKGVIYL